MDNNIIGALIYFVVAFVVAIVSATIMRVKLGNCQDSDIAAVFFGLLFGAVWPFIIVAVVVYFASDFLYGKFLKVKES